MATFNQECIYQLFISEISFVIVEKRVTTCRKSVKKTIGVPPKRKQHMSVVSYLRLVQVNDKGDVVYAYHKTSKVGNLDPRGMASGWSMRLSQEGKASHSLTCSLYNALH